MKNKPVILWPAIIVYKLVHYLLVGIFFSLYSFIKIFIDAGMFISFLWWKVVKFIGFPLIFIFKLFKKDDPLKNEDKHKIKNEKNMKKHEKQMAEIKKKVAEKEESDKEKLSKIEAKRKKEDEAKEKAEREAEVKEQQQLLKEAKEQAEKQKELTLVAEAANAGLAEPRELTEKEKKVKEKLEMLEKKKQEKEEARKRKEELQKEKEKLKDKNLHLDGETIEPKKAGDKINDALEKMISGPKKIIEKTKKSLENNALVRNKKNEELMKREALLINFDGDDAEKSDKKQVYEYVGRNAEGKIVKDHFEAFSKVEVHSFLLSEGFEVYSIKTNRIINFLHGTKEEVKGKIKNKDLVFFLTQLSTYIKAGIPLVEALRILSRQFKEKSYEKIFRSLIYELTMGDNFSDAMAKQGSAFPRILVNMVKAAEMIGELPETLDDMASYFDEMEKTKKQMVTALTYPVIIFVLAIFAIGFIMIYIVPQFVTIYEDMDNAELPWITVAVLALSNFLKKYLIVLIIGIIALVIGFIWLYKNVKLFRTMCQWIIMKLPIIGNVIIYNEVTMFTKTFASLLKHNVFITDTMDILNKITSNEIWKMIILDTITNLAKGDKISLAFQEHWAVPIPAYEMIVTGERTGQLPEMMQKVSDYYQELHKNQVGRIKAFVEPILLLFLTGAVGLIVMSIIIPMFGMYSQLS